MRVMPLTPKLAIALSPVVGFAEHLAVGHDRGSAGAPGSDVVGIHLVKFPDFGFVRVGTDRTEWAV